MTNETPIMVNSNPGPAQAMAALRMVLMSAGAVLTARGVLKPEDIATLGVILPALGTLAVFLWSQWATHKNATKLAVVAEAAPDSVAVTK